MTPQRRRAAIGLAVLVVLLIGVLVLRWFMTRHQDNVAATARHGEQITNSIPDIAAAFGQDSVGQLREDSCLGSPDPERAPRTTRWVARTGTTAPSMREARDRAASVRDEAEAQGWTTQDRAAVGPNSEQLYTGVRGDLTLVVVAGTIGDGPEVTLSITSPCLDKPAGHTMTRSEYDPMYGSSDPMYPDDDRSEFTNGEPKPFRTGSPTG